MATILTVLGSIVLGLLIIILVVVLGFILKFRRMMRQLPKSMEALRAFGASFQPQPARIALERRKEAGWNQKSRAEACVAALVRLGYQPRGIFACDDLNGAIIAAFVHPGSNLRAAVCEMAGTILWVDVVARFADGSLTVANTPVTGTLIKRSGHDKLALPEADAEGLHLRALQELAGRTCLAVPPDQAAFAREFESFYADEMDHLALQEPTAEQIQAIGKRSGLPTDDQAVAQTMEVERMKRRALLCEVLKAHYRSSDPLAEAGWSAIEDRVLVTHDRQEVDEIRALLEDIADPLPTIAPDLRGRARFRALNEALPADRRCQFLATVATPIPADLWLAPEETEEEDEDEAEER